MGFVCFMRRRQCSRRLKAHRRQATEMSIKWEPQDSEPVWHESGMLTPITTILCSFSFYILLLIQLHSKDFPGDNQWLVASSGDFQNVNMHTACIVSHWDVLSYPVLLWVCLELPQMALFCNAPFLLCSDQTFKCTDSERAYILSTLLMGFFFSESLLCPSSWPLTSRPYYFSHQDAPSLHPFPPMDQLALVSPPDFPSSSTMTHTLRETQQSSMLELELLPPPQHSHMYIWFIFFTHENPGVG